MLTALSQRVLDYIRCHPDGVKIATLEVMCLKPDGARYPPQEIEAAVSQLKRANFIAQRQPGLWMPATEGPIHVEREPDHVRIRETGVVDRVEETVAFKPTYSISVDSRADREAVRRDVAAITQERTMPIGKRKCSKCEEFKGNRAFEKGAEICRGCNGTNKATKPKAEKPARAKAQKKSAAKRSPRKQLRSIVNRHARRAGEDPVLAQLESARARVAEKLAAIEGAIAAYKQAA